MFLLLLISQLSAVIYVHNSSLLNNVERPLWFEQKRFPKKFVADYCHFIIICEIICHVATVRI